MVVTLRALGLCALFASVVLAQTPNTNRFLGAVCDGNSHPLSTKYSSLSAVQAVYPFVTSLSQETDYAAIKAASNVAFGPDGGEHSTNTAQNVPLYLPAGTCVFGNDTWLIRNADGIQIRGAGKTATTLTGNGIVLQFDGLWYSDISDFGITTKNSTSIVAMDVDGNVPGHPYSTRSVQGNNFRNLIVGGGGSSYSLAMCRHGGSGAQCSEDIFTNVHLHNASTAAYLQYGYNALDNVYIGGDIQGFYQDGMEIWYGSIKVIGTSFEGNEGCTNLNNGGYDINASYGGAYGSIVILGARTESLTFYDGNNYSPAYIAGLTHVPAFSGWTAATQFSAAQALKRQGTDGNYHLYCVTTAGTTGASEPTWPASGTVADGSVVWTATPYNAINMQTGGWLDYASSYLDPTGRIASSGQTWEMGSLNTLSAGAQWGAQITGDNTALESFINSQGKIIDLYANPQSSPVLSSVTGISLPSGVGLMSPGNKMEFGTLYPTVAISPNGLNSNTTSVMAGTSQSTNIFQVTDSNVSPKVYVDQNYLLNANQSVQTNCLETTDTATSAKTYLVVTNGALAISTSKPSTCN